MLKKTLAALLVAACAGTAGLEYSSGPAQAAMPTGKLPLTVSEDAGVQNVAWVYVPRRHGPRYRYRRPGYAYHYGGWWYPRPYWRAGPMWYGPRYRFRRPGYAYYYGGWWYPRPWWRPGVSLCIGC
jgi:hypothetical protein